MTKIVFATSKPTKTATRILENASAFKANLIIVDSQCSSKPLVRDKLFSIAAVKRALNDLKGSEITKTAFKRKLLLHCGTYTATPKQLSIGLLEVLGTTKLVQEAFFSAHREAYVKAVAHLGNDQLLNDSFFQISFWEAYKEHFLKDSIHPHKWTKAYSTGEACYIQNIFEEFDLIDTFQQSFKKAVTSAIEKTCRKAASQLVDEHEEFVPEVLQKVYNLFMFKYNTTFYDTFPEAFYNALDKMPLADFKLMIWNVSKDEQSRYYEVSLQKEGGVDLFVCNTKQFTNQFLQKVKHLPPKVEVTFL